MFPHVISLCLVKLGHRRESISVAPFRIYFLCNELGALLRGRTHTLLYKMKCIHNARLLSMRLLSNIQEYDQVLGSPFPEPTT